MSVLRWMMLVVLAVTQFAWFRAALAQPVGPEFQVNTYTTLGQGRPAVATDGTGNFVVVWSSYGSAGTDTGSASVQGQRYDSTGAPLGGQFQVNTYTTNHQRKPAVAIDGAGNFVVVWEHFGVGMGPIIQGQRYDSTGAPLGGQFQVNTYTTFLKGDPAVATDGTGNFVVVWQSGGSAGTDTSGYSVQGRRYDSTGAPLGGQFQVNTFTTNSQYRPAVATDGAGNFVVAWESDGSAGTDTSFGSIQGQRYDGTGVPLGGEFQANTYTTSGQRYPAVATDGTGNFVVVWDSVESAGTDTHSIQGQRYDSTGAPLGGQFHVNTYTTNYQSDPAVATDGTGNFVVVWQSDAGAGTDTSFGSTQGQRYDSMGAPLGGQFQVNTYTTIGQGYPAVATDGAGNFVVVWQSGGSAGTDTSNYSIQGQRFGVPTTTSTSPTSSTTSTSSTSSTTSTSTSSTTSTTLPTTDLVPGRIGIIKPGTLAKFVAKPVTGDTFALPSGDPVTVGGSLRIFDLGTTAGDNTYTLPTGGTPPLGWKGLGSPAGSKGYKYKGAGTPSDPCKVVLVKETVIKGVCKGTGITLAPPFTGDVGIVLSLGTTDRYCAQFGGEEVKNDPTITKLKNALAPGACP